MSGGGRIRDLIARLEQTASAEWRTQLSLKLADKTKELIQHGFDNAVTPYGDPWVARKKPYPWPPLQKSKTLRNKFEIQRCDQFGCIVGNRTPYASFQQYGTKRIPPRQFIPYEAWGLGKWREPLAAVVANALRDLLNGK